MEISAVGWLWKVVQEHLKNPFNAGEWEIAIEFAKKIEDERIKKAYIDGAINTQQNIFAQSNSFLNENNLKQKLENFISQKSNLN
jgi:hypothetical protein